jgi:hypothetical protein
MVRGAAERFLPVRHTMSTPGSEITSPEGHRCCLDFVAHLAGLSRLAIYRGLPVPVPQEGLRFGKSIQDNSQAKRLGRRFFLQK